ncbi:MAG: type III-A CRISPR-associated RAMP protein Csm3 [Deltaproteobacteria bacterium]|nr:MAG: type III-A CRISPR-associated RAMP protein Csm3 [Deltaproteobacteria bacterium]
MKLVEFKEITGKIILRTGLHIGGGDTEMKIGGTDNPVIKHPYSQEPYIPGSSLKGKVRSLLEMRSGLMVGTKGSPVSLKTLKKLNGKEKEDCEKILKLFGASGADQDAGNTLGPTRASFADCPLEKGWKEKVLKEHWSYTEVKSENSINRIMGTAENSRFTERVPADTVFEFSITLKQLGLDEKLEEFLLEGLKLLQMDSLGGSGSRGYGRVEFEFDDNDITKKFETTSPL